MMEGYAGGGRMDDIDNEDVAIYHPFEDKIMIGEAMADNEHLRIDRTPAENPKTKAGAKKPSLFSVIPTAALLHLGEVMKLGAIKYGPFNWRQTPVPAETYVDAIGRHLLSWQDGESVDPESGMSHLAHIMASCAILIDAEENGMLDDDRPKAGRVGEMISTFQRTGKFHAND
jgi:Domain of unknown function (DUF5664)